MSAGLRQLPVKSVRWTANLLLSAFLTWTTLNYFIQPRQLVDTIRGLGAAVLRMPLKIVRLPKAIVRSNTPTPISTVSQKP